MTETLRSVTQRLNTVLLQAEKRITTILVLFAVNVGLTIWIVMNFYHTAQTQQETRGLLQVNQSILENLDTEQSKQLTLEKKIREKLASRDDLNGLILSLESTAPAHGVTLSDANQSYVEASRDKLPYSLIQYTVQGNYAGVLQFVAESLNKNEALVLKSLTFRRSDPLVSNLQINLELALYYP